MKKATKNTIKKSVICTLLALSSVGANAYENDKTTLTCSTPATCGTYSAENAVSVYAAGTEMRLTWGQNVPAGIAAGRYKAHTIGASCPLGSVQSNLTAEWFLEYSGRPRSARVLHCDGSTVSEYDISQVIEPPTFPGW